MTQVELMMMEWIQHHLRSDILDTIMLWFTRIGDYGIVWIALAVIFVCFPKTRGLAWQLVIALVLMLLVNNIVLKTLFSRARPCVIDTTVSLLVRCPSSYSFPSGHTSSSFAAFGILYFSRQVPRWAKWLSGFVAVMVSVSRVYLYVHFFSDVLIGAIVGWVIALISVKWVYPKFMQWYFKKQVEKNTHFNQ